MCIDAVDNDFPRLSTIWEIESISSYTIYWNESYYTVRVISTSDSKQIESREEFTIRLSLQRRFWITHAAGGESRSKVSRRGNIIARLRRPCDWSLFLYFLWRRIKNKLESCGSEYSLSLWSGKTALLCCGTCLKMKLKTHLAVRPCNFSVYGCGCGTFSTEKENYRREVKYVKLRVLDGHKCIYWIENLRRKTSSPWWHSITANVGINKLNSEKCRGKILDGFNLIGHIIGFALLYLSK